MNAKQTLLASGGALAAVQTVTLSVPGMNCPVCPITVKKANASFEQREAKIAFDDAITNSDKLMQAATDAGYPSTLKGAAK
jgi:mercuric ion binding protein